MAESIQLQIVAQDSEQAPEDGNYVSSPEDLKEQLQATYPKQPEDHMSEDEFKDGEEAEPEDEDVDMPRLEQTVEEFIDKRNIHGTIGWTLHEKKKPNGSKKEKRLHMFCHKPGKIKLPQFHMKVIDRSRNSDTFNKIITKPFTELYYDTGKGQRVVFWDCSIRDISAIKLEEETFDVSIRFYLTWLAQSKDILDGTWDSRNSKTWKAPSEPKKLTIVNKKEGQLEAQFMKITVASDYAWHDEAIRDADGHDWCLDEKQKRKRELMGFDARQGIWVRAQYYFRGTVTEEFELHSFPFDCQDLKIIIRCEEDVVFVPLASRRPFLSFNPQRSTLGDFSVVTVGAEFGKTDPDRSRGERVKGHIFVVVKIQRNWSSTLHVMFAVVSMTLLSLVVFTLDPAPGDGDMGERVNYLVTLILTDIAFQQSVKSRLPSTSYLTALDKFIWGSFAFKTLVLIWIGIPYFPIFPPSITEGQLATNITATWIFSIGFMVYVVATVVFFVLLRVREQRKNYLSSKELMIRYGIEDDPIYQVELDRWTAHLLKDDKQTYNRYSQYGTKIKISNSLQGNVELVNFHAAERKRRLTLQIDNGTLFACCLVAFLAQVVVLQQFGAQLYVQFILIEGICSFMYLGWVVWDAQNNPEFFFHNKLIQMLAIVAASLFSAARLDVSQPRFVRSFAMYGVLSVWAIARAIYNMAIIREYSSFETWDRVRRYQFVWEAVYNDLFDEREQKKREHLHRTQTSTELDASKSRESSTFTSLPKDIVAGQPVLLDGEQPSKGISWKTFQKYVNFGLKHFMFGYLHGFRIIVLMSPVFVVQVAKSTVESSGQIPTGFTWSDGIGIFFGVWGMTIWLLSLAYVRRNSFNFNTVKPAVALEQKFDRLKTGMALQSSDFLSSPTSEHGNPIGESPCNPFSRIRFPFQLSWVFVWFGFWIVSWVVYPHFFVGFVSSLCPLVAVIWDIWVVVPLLDGIYDENYGTKDEYRKYRYSQAAVWPWFFRTSTSQFNIRKVEQYE